MSAKLLPPQSYLLECFSYDPDSGVLLWNVRPPHHFASLRGMNIFNGKYAGKAAGGVNSQGYLHVRLANNELHRVHRIIWKLVTGQDPREHIDHKDRNRLNNTWANLREATNGQNAHNASNTTGTYFHKASGKWHARITVNGVTHSLRYHSTKEAAQAAYMGAAKRMQGDFHPIAA